MAVGLVLEAKALVVVSGKKRCDWPCSKLASVVTYEPVSRRVRALGLCVLFAQFVGTSVKVCLACVRYVLSVVCFKCIGGVLFLCSVLCIYQ